MATIGDQWNSVGWITVPTSSNSGTGTYISLSSSSNVVSLKDLPYWPQAPDMDIAKAQKMLMAAAKALQTMRQMAEQLKGLEITTLKQSLTTSKHSKIRKLQALYPGIRVKIIHKKDYLELMGRYGKDEGE